MINSEAFAGRLKKIMDYYQLTASSFADKIQVQRSSISHILSGRNKPSLEFVMKVLKQFPEVDLYWLMNGKGSFPKTEAAATTLPKRETVQQERPAESGMPVRKIEASGKEIERIVIFYTDGTFKEYRS